MCHLCLLLSPLSALLPPGKGFIELSLLSHLRRVSARSSDSFRLSGLLHTGEKFLQGLRKATA